VLRELLHARLPVGLLETRDAGLTLAARIPVVWSVEAEDVRLAGGLRRVAMPHGGI
jgi:hypothetical protein